MLFLVLACAGFVSVSFSLPSDVVKGSVKQSRLLSQFAFPCCNLLQLLNTPKMYHCITFCISIFNFEVFKMDFKWGIKVILIWAPIFKLKCLNANWDLKSDCWTISRATTWRSPTAQSTAPTTCTTATSTASAAPTPAGFWTSRATTSSSIFSREVSLELAFCNYLQVVLDFPCYTGIIIREEFWLTWNYELWDRKGNHSLFGAALGVIGHEQKEVQFPVLMLS